MGSLDKKRFKEIMQLYSPLETLGKNLSESSGRLESNRKITDTNLLIEKVNHTLEYYRYLLHLFKTMGETYDQYALPNVLRQEKLQVVINLPSVSTYYFDRDMSKKYSSSYFNKRFQYDFTSCNNRTSNQIFTLEVRNKRLYHLSIDLNSENVNQETIEEIEYLLATFISILSTIKECMLNDWKAYKR